ncbi:unnamed protein product [Amoebophrya sp. A120]|nr:unnamed protein product [Amoebophrya sp. A120]|eukprot:GSA120T00022547001.1
MSVTRKESNSPPSTRERQILEFWVPESEGDQTQVTLYTASKSECRYRARTTRQDELPVGARTLEEMVKLAENSIEAFSRATADLRLESGRDGAQHAGDTADDALQLLEYVIQAEIAWEANGEIRKCMITQHYRERVSAAREGFNAAVQEFTRAKEDQDARNNPIVGRARASRASSSGYSLSSDNREAAKVQGAAYGPESKINGLAPSSSSTFRRTRTERGRDRRGRSADSDGNKVATSSWDRKTADDRDRKTADRGEGGRERDRRSSGRSRSARRRKRSSRARSRRASKSKTDRKAASRSRSRDRAVWKRSVEAPQQGTGLLTGADGSGAPKAKQLSSSSSSLRRSYNTSAKKSERFLSEAEQERAVFINWPMHYEHAAVSPAAEADHDCIREELFRRVGGEHRVVDYYCQDEHAVVAVFADAADVEKVLEASQRLSLLDPEYQADAFSYNRDRAASSAPVPKHDAGARQSGSSVQQAAGAVSVSSGCDVKEKEKEQDEQEKARATGSSSALVGASASQLVARGAAAGASSKGEAEEEPLAKRKKTAEKKGGALVTKRNKAAGAGPASGKNEENNPSSSALGRSKSKSTRAGASSSGSGVLCAGAASRQTGTLTEDLAQQVRLKVEEFVFTVGVKKLKAKCAELGVRLPERTSLLRVRAYALQKWSKTLKTTDRPSLLTLDELRRRIMEIGKTLIGRLSDLEALEEAGAEDARLETARAELKAVWEKFDTIKKVTDSYIEAENLPREENEEGSQN